MGTVLPSFEPSKLQVEFSERVADAFGAPDPARDEGGELSLLEAGTGTGKTLGYLVPLMVNAALTGERSLVSTHTLALMDQIMQKDGPLAVEAVKQATGKTVTIASRRGRRNFIDVDRIEDLITELTKAGGGEKDIVALQGWADFATAKDSSGLIAEAFEHAGLTLPVNVSPEDICLMPGSSDRASRAYRQHVDVSDKADIVITNHALALIDAKLWGRLIHDSDTAPGRPKIAVFDEADALASTAQSLAEARVAWSTLDQLCKALPRGDDKSHLRQALNALLVELKKSLVQIDLVVKTGTHQPLIDSVEETVETLRAVRVDDQELRQALREAAGNLGDWLDAAKGDRYLVPAITASPVRSRPSLVTISVNPARILSRLWARRRDGSEPWLRSVVFVSATLSAPAVKPDFSSFMREVGINPAWSNFASARSGQIDEPSRFGQLSFVLADRGLGKPTITDKDGYPATNPDWLDYISSGVKQAQMRGGRVLVLTTSYKDAEDIGNRVSDAIVHKRGQKLNDLLERYRAKDDAVLITPAAWAGVDLPGLVDQLVIPRVPFAAPDEAREAVMVRAMRNVEKPRPKPEAFSWVSERRWQRGSCARGSDARSGGHRIRPCAGFWTRVFRCRRR